MSYALLALGHRVGLLAFGERVVSHCPRGRGQRHSAAIARLLTALQPAYAGERSALGASAPFLKGATTIFAISDFLADDEMRGDLSAILQRCAALHVLQVRDAAETRMREAGEFDLVDVETGAQVPAEVGARADALAAGERADMTARLRGFCARSGAAFTDFDIEQAWQQALLRHLLRARSTC
jgi:uncharacterized protein (DUF58 family)